MERWPEALEEVVDRLEGSETGWMLVGSAATALHGVAITPGDFDVLVRDPADVRRAAGALPSPETTSRHRDPGEWLSSVPEPILEFGEGSRWTFGRWVIRGVRVEVANIEDPAAAGRLIETTGALVWEARSSVLWRGRSVPVIPLEVQIATMLVRGQSDRLTAVAAVPDRNSLDRRLLRRALRDRPNAAAAELPLPPWLERMLR